MVDTTDIMFDTVRFMEPAHRSLAIANTGQVPVQFEFIKKPGEDRFCRPWLLVEPSSGFIMQGEHNQSFSINNVNFLDQYLWCGTELKFKTVQIWIRMEYFTNQDPDPDVLGPNDFFEFFFWQKTLKTLKTLKIYNKPSRN